MKKIHIELLRFIHIQCEVVKWVVYEVKSFELPDNKKKKVSFSKKLDTVNNRLQDTYLLLQGYPVATG